jgi:N-acetylglucosamine-6-phosphate deacetylase
MTEAVGHAGVIIHSTTIVSDRALTDDAWIAFGGESITARGVGAGWLALRGPRTQIIDGTDATLTPGFVDIHVHGGGGSSFTDGPEAIAAGLAAHRRHGTTRSVVSLVSARPSDIRRQVADVRHVMAHDPLVLGVHLEGPFLAGSHRGAHDETLLTAPTDAAVGELLDITGGVLRHVTLAPELPGAHAAIRRFIESGARVALGHTSAGYDESLEAFDLGASILTHAFNGMRAVHHRAPGPVAAALDSAHVTLELVGDGTHVLGPVARILSQSAADRLCLVSDAMAAAASTDGDYLLGSLAVRVVGGVARLVDGGSIAGSTLTMDGALRFAIAELRLDLPAAVALVTEVPARALGLAESIGSLAVGYPADAVLLDDSHAVTRVWANGAPVPVGGPIQFVG